ncbi:unnamed protein product [Chironomus riparius]|uniref:Tudor domain-containing protein n=1 Tax=Chironomus riparius TaxID=315576 RepID=A0A9N9RTE8_9DIPT|nr:unnamed protein product [Chironomus riparius]
MKNMQEYYIANLDSLRINVQDLKRGLYVAALYNGIWHRGMIVKNDERFARIFNVDFGTVVDIRHFDLCYLKQDFLKLPSIARRGVLAFVQPLQNDMWSNEARILFEKCFRNKKIEIKILKYNSRDNSYLLEMKYENDHKIVELLTDSLIKNNIAEPDSMFLDNESVSKDSYGFQEYEEGILLDIKSPIPIVIEAYESSKTPFKVTKKTSASSILSTLSTNSSIEFNNSANKGINQAETPEDAREEMKVVEDSYQTFSSSIKLKQIINECPSVINNQSFEILTSGNQVEIYIHVFFDVSCFFFYVKNEMSDIKKFLDDLNARCKESKKCLNVEDLMLNKEVVIFNDNNYCRGRINSKIEDLYQVYLIDFGVFVTRKCNEIFQIHKEFIKRKCCIYKGCTSDTLTNEKQVGSFRVAKILGILNENTVQLKLNH